VISNGKSTFLRVYNSDGDPFSKTSHIAVPLLFIIELSKFARLNRVSFMFIDSYTTNCLLLAHVSRYVTITCKIFRVFCVELFGLQPKLLLNVPRTLITSNFSEMLAETFVLTAASTSVGYNTLSNYFET
jgi:hypothetical protein